MQLFKHLATSLGLALALTACGGGGEAHEDSHDHGHSHSAKFGGYLVELGDHFANLEVVHDTEAGSMAIYVLGAHAEELVKSSTEALSLSINVHADEPLTFTLPAEENEVTKNKKGASAKFTVTDERLKELDHGHCTIASVEARGETFEDVKFDLGGHEDDHDHDHDGDDHGEGSDG